MKTKHFIQLFIAAILLLVHQTSLAGIIQYGSVISTPSNGTPPVIAGTSTATATVSIVPGSGTHTDRLVRGILTFGVDHRYPKIISSSRTRISVTVKRWSNQALATADMSDTTVIMEVSYSPNDSLSFEDKLSIHLPGVKKYQATINQVWVNGTSTTTLPANLTLKLDLYVDRYYDFAGTAVTITTISEGMLRTAPIDLDCDGVSDEWPIMWTPVVGAEEYQVEWAYVNYYGDTPGSELPASALYCDYKRNSTRISTTSTSYNLSLVYDKGYICYRVRAIGRKTSDLTKVVYGAWSSTDYFALSATSHKYKNDVAYQGNKNWQYSTTYAEEGKKKETISFFDGSLRNRQSVTKMASDTNVVVGETIYDHQGRPAIQVLPVPVDDPTNCSIGGNTASLKFYPNFTKNEAGSAYSRADFDLNAGADTCNISTGAMGTASGASRYYSSSNPYKKAEQSFVPDAKLYPFTQVEYTPDNTGRIRRQSGVGNDFKLGSGHETKYYYGHPSQIQLDRMFGSEAGHYAHYQKNMVADPNGQISISYLDQEGRVIATSLAGTPPSNLMALDQSNSGINITENLLVRDAQGNATANQLSQDGRTAMVNETFLVSTPTTMQISYDLTIAPLPDPCITDFCFGCVYDLTIRIIDDCGADLTNQYGFGGKKMIGHLAVNGKGEPSFTPTCSNMQNHKLSRDTTITISTPGNYQIIKILSINEDALDFFVDHYMDPETNRCIRTLDDFNNTYLHNTDFSSCNPIRNCDSCLTAIGTAEQFIAAGRGTMEDYQIAVEMCSAPCKQARMQDIQLQMLLTDMSPAGQYAEYLSPSGTYEPSLFPVSILNTGNVLPLSNAGGVKSWRTPSILINGTSYAEYREADSLTRSRIIVTPVFTGTTITNSHPQALNLANIYQDAATGAYYIYPENLKHVSDFVQYWKDSWAYSLLKYHPEYAQYQIYGGYTKQVTPGDAYTSSSFDDLLRNTNTFAEAKARGFISASNTVNNWFAVSSTVPWDPFVVYSSGYLGYGAMLSAKFSNHTSGLTMVQIASATSRCENSILGASVSTIASCSNFGGGTTAEQDKEWKKLVSLYLSAKLEYQQKRAAWISVHDASYWGYNACIGNSDFNPLNDDFSDFAVFSLPPSQYLNPLQPCNSSTRQYYEHKALRYPNAYALTADYNSIVYQHYLTTGQSPIAANFQYFLNEAAELNKLSTSSFSASALSTFPGFYLANNNNVPAAVPATTWTQTTMNTTTLTASLTSSGPAQSISLTKPATINGVPFGWNHVKSLYGLHYLSTSGSNRLFEITARVYLSGEIGTITLTGSTTYNIGDYTYQEACKPNQLTTDLAMLMDALASSSKLNSATAVVIGAGSGYAPFATTAIKAQASSGSVAKLKWIYNSSVPGFQVYDTSATAQKLQLAITATAPASFNLATSLGNVKSFSQVKYTGTNTFEITGLDASGNFLVTLKCSATRHLSSTSTPVVMGTCALPQPSACSGPAYTNITQLNNLLFNVLSTQSSSTPGYNLYASTLMTPAIQAQLPAGTTYTTSVSSSTLVGGIYRDTIKIQVPNGCPIVVSIANETPLSIYTMNSIVSTHLTGETDAWGNYHSYYIIADFGGVESSKYQDTIFIQSCFPVNHCDPAPNTTDAGANFPKGVFEDPCTDYLTSLAYANALNAYNDYADSLRNAITQKYIRHCMSGIEKLTRSYSENEYHRTLYYYDQAGNLIKTIPPEGVELLNISSDTDPVELAILADRTNGTHNILTQHRMATTYEYNSLNQLVKQSMPDQGAMDIWEITLPNGLQAGLNTTAIQMVNSNTGYLTGWATISGKVRGFLYRTDNGGSNWIKVNNTVASNLKKIQMTSATTGYAVGSYGVALKTVDGGSTWDMLNTYANSITADLNDLYFSSDASGRFVGNNGVEIVTTNGGSTFTTTTTVIPTGYAGNTIQSINFIEPAGSSFYYGLTMNNAGTLYDIITLGTSTNTWVAQPIQGSDYYSIHFYDANNGIAAGADGNLVSIFVPTTGTGHIQTSLESGMSNKILKAFFVNASRGIALVEDGSNKALRFTTNGGKTWSPVDNAQVNYNDVQLAAQVFSTSVELIATGANAHTSRIVLTATVDPAIIDQTNYTTPQALNITAAQIVQDGTGRRIIAGTSDGKLYYSNLIGNGSQPVTYTLISSTLASGYATKILLNYFSATSGLTGIILTSTGKVYPINRANASPTYTLSAALGVSTAVFTDITGSGTILYGFNGDANRIYRIDLTSSAATATLLSNGVVGTAVVTALGVSQGGRITFVGKDGDMRTSAMDWSTGNPGGGWQSRSNLRMTPLHDLQFIAGDNALATGNNGMLMKRNTYNSVLTFMITPLNVQNDLRAITPNGSNYLLAGGKGFAASYTYTTNAVAPLALNNGQLTTDYFTQTDFYAAGVSGTNAYIAGANGTVLYSQNTADQPFTFTTNTYAADLRSLSIVPGQTGSFVRMLAVGNQSNIFRFSGTFGVQIKQVFSDTMYNLHFANANVGTIVGKGYFARQTFDGGNTWRVVLPSHPIYLPMKLSTVWTLPDGFGIIAGNTYIAKIVNGLAYTPTGYTDIFRDIDFAANSPLEGWIATSTRVRKLTLTPLGNADYTLVISNFYTGTGNAIHAVHAFENGGVIAAGAGGYIGYLKPGATTATAWTTVSMSGMSGVTYKDLYFHDDATGYAVGSNSTNGVIIRTANVSYSTTSSYNKEITGITWTSKLLTGDGTVTAATNVSSVNAITFGSRHDGIWGGSYATGFAGAQATAYARKIHDESSEFSSRFYYDKLGRLVVSQNARQYALSPQKYSYTLYDALGRVYEAGEKTENASGMKFAQVFGTLVNDLFNPNVIDDGKLGSWIADAGARSEVTRSYYDNTVITGLPITPDVRTQRKRITHVTYEAVYDNNDQTFDHATHYDYDIHGNVKTLLQDNRKLSLLDASLAAQRYKRLDYVYDLVSGNVHRVSYESGKADQWHHAYTYDADNRLADVRTTTTTPLVAQAYGIAVMRNETMTPYWEKEASYKYYDHGPLARTELGQEKAQGIDYLYTLQGWLKGVNSSTLASGTDPGQDGLSAAKAAADAFSFGLHYFAGDYKAINTDKNTTLVHPFALQTGTDDLRTNSSDLYNGNIARMVTTLTNPTTREVLALGNAYRYDQLHRIKESRSFSSLDLTTNSWKTAGSYKGTYYNAFSYDQNGNITSQHRRDEQGKVVDHLTYRYLTNAGGKKLQNRLYLVNDTVRRQAFPDDINDMGLYNNNNPNSGAYNYKYDLEGRLVKDTSEKIDSIAWRVDGKVLKIFRKSGSGQKNLIFDYDAMGNRIAKHVLSTANALEKSTYYILDATGNTMAVYERTVNPANQTIEYYQSEKHIYGSSRLGMLDDKIPLLGSQNATYSMRSVRHRAGKRTYELSNHLGNVLSTISDKIIPHNNGAGVPDYYLADIRTAQDYSPFGVTLSGRNFTLSGGAKSRYGFNGMERDDEVKGEGNSYDFGARMYDNRLGRWLTIDPLAPKYSSISPYTFVLNNPCLLLDLDGKEWINVHELKAKELEKKLLDNPNDKKLKREFNREVIKSKQVNQSLQTLKESDPSLYNYINDLKVIDAKTNEAINVNVKVKIKAFNESPNGESASTSYSNYKSDKATRIWIYYESQEEHETSLPGPINFDDEIGFNVTLYGSGEFLDGSLANEAGDIMFRMEYPAAAKKSGSDNGKSEEQYRKPGSAGYYSFKVEEIYKKRKKDGTGKDVNNNPYPLKNETDENKKD